jgi:hypothetical protein
LSNESARREEEVNRKLMLLGATVVFAALIVAAEGQTVTVSVNPKGGFLRTCNDNQASPTVVVLSNYGYAAGDLLRLSWTDDSWLNQWGYPEHYYPDTDPDWTERILAVFSSSNVLGPKIDQHRVLGAIDTGNDVLTPNTWFPRRSEPPHGYPTDISEDFALVTGGVCIVVPENAQYLFLGIRDSYYTDNAGLVNVAIERCAIEVMVDVKPGSCPNPFNVNAQGVLPVAILGASDFDVTEVDVATVLLESAAPIHTGIDDVSGPVEGQDVCDCETQWKGPDGFDDLTLKFDTQEIAASLGEVNDGDLIALTLTGELTRGRPIEGMSCVLIREKGGGQSAKTGPSVPVPVNLFQNSPNPFRSQTTLQFSLPEAMRTTLTIHDVTGRTLATLVDGKYSSGSHTVEWDADVGCGTYFYRLSTSEVTLTRKMAVVR